MRADIRSGANISVSDDAPILQDDATVSDIFDDVQFVRAGNHGFDAATVDQEIYHAALTLRV